MRECVFGAAGFIKYFRRGLTKKVRMFMHHVSNELRHATYIEVAREDAIEIGTSN